LYAELAKVLVQKTANFPSKNFGAATGPYGGPDPDGP